MSVVNLSENAKAQLQKVIEQLKVPDIYHFDWNHFHIHDTACGTSCCIGGWIIFNKAVEAGTTYNEFADSFDTEETILDSDDLVSMLLEIKGEDAFLINRFLIYPWDWEDADSIDVHEMTRLHRPDGYAYHLSTSRGPWAIREAISRIQWLIDGKDLSEYRITVPTPEEYDPAYCCE
jgi:hypothetical protein